MNLFVCVCLFACLVGWLVFLFMNHNGQFLYVLSEIEMLMNLALYRNRHPQAFCFVVMENFLIAAWLAQLVHRQSAVREVEGLSPRPDHHSGS